MIRNGEVNLNREIKNNRDKYYLDPEHIGKAELVREYMKGVNNINNREDYKGRATNLSMSIVEYLKKGYYNFKLDVYSPYYEFTNIEFIEIDIYFPEAKDGYLEEDIINKYSIFTLLRHQIGILYREETKVTKWSARDYPLEHEDIEIYLYSVFRDNSGISIQELNQDSHYLDMPFPFYKFCEKMGLTLKAAKELYGLNDYFHNRNLKVYKFKKNEYSKEKII